MTRPWISWMDGWIDAFPRHYLLHRYFIYNSLILTVRAFSIRWIHVFHTRLPNATQTKDLSHALGNKQMYSSGNMLVLLCVETVFTTTAGRYLGSTSPVPRYLHMNPFSSISSLLDALLISLRHVGKCVSKDSLSMFACEWSAGGVYNPEWMSAIAVNQIL